ncbi:hypothetical protein M9H77_04520 [Catharanthus roseus]|uniref:Uncharacterized protein n=1 Tax=Catharanthus roseus TaxID=4058 RepID=A0ACC0CEN0_CATRO|nr:hypothetical protein M9H77_04520 [Catharanthus roseus]
MLRPSGRRGDDNLGPVTNRTGRVEGCIVIASSRSGYSIQPPAVPFRSRPPLQPHLSHTPMIYEPNGFAHPPSHPTDKVYDPYLHTPTIMLGAAPQDSSCSTHKYSHAEYGVSSSDPYVPGPADRVFEGDKVVDEEQERMREVMMMAMVVMMMEMRSRPYMLHLWHQLMYRTGVLITGKGRV